MSVKCPAGHSSKATDYCDVCGARIDTAAASTAAGAAKASPATEPAVKCPHCGDLNAAAALFCEACGYDFTTGQLPDVGATLAGKSPKASPPAAPVEWVAEIWVDPDWYAHEAVSSTDPCPTAGTPRIVALRSKSELVGRTSASRNLHPAVDCGSDSAVSRRHAEITIDAGHAYIEDLNSVNGTYVAKSGAPLPERPIPPGRRRAVTDDERVYVGAWTRLVIRPATAEERGA